MAEVERQRSRRRTRNNASPFPCCVCNTKRRGVAVAVDYGANASQLHVCLAALAKPHAATDGRDRVCGACYQAVRKSLANAEPIVLGSQLGRRVAGLGLVAQRNYERGERVTRAGGRVLATDAARRLHNTTRLRSVEPLRTVVDGSSGYRSGSDVSRHVLGLGQFANTSSERHLLNCRFDDERDASGLAVDAVWLVTTRNIALGEELLVSYGRSFARSARRLGRHASHRRGVNMHRAGNNALEWRHVEAEGRKRKRRSL